MKLITIDDICEMLQLSRTYTLNNVVKREGFPLPAIGNRKPRWDQSAVIRYFKLAQKANIVPFP